MPQQTVRLNWTSTNEKLTDAKGRAAHGTRACRSRHGFTLIELLVVIAIIAVLVSLLLPAVQQVREAARKTQCKNNLKQMGLALHNYHDAFNTFPLGYCAAMTYGSGTVPGGDDTDKGWGWSTYILPYMDQATLYNQFNFGQSIATFTAIQTQLPVYLCPSDLAPQGPIAIQNTASSTIATAAVSSYGGFCGGDESDTADLTGTGVFYRNSSVKFSDITDGASNTLMVGERATCNARGIWAGAINKGLVLTGPQNKASQTATEPAACLVLIHAHLLNLTLDADGGLDDSSSLHSGGALMLFADGSVHFFRSIPFDNSDGSYTSDGLIFQAFATRAGGETVPGSWAY